MTDFTLNTALESQATGQERPVVIEFLTPDCQPCLLQERLVNAVSVDVANQADVVQIDLDAHPELAEAYNVKTVPSVLIVNQGKVTARFAGLIDRGSIVAAVQAA